MRYANYQTAKNNTQLFESLLSKDHLMIIEDDELRTIAGGDPTPAQVTDLMDKLFTTTPIFVQASGGVGTTLWDAFKTQVQDLARTNIGFAMLTAMDGLNNQVTISPIDPFPNNEGGASWDHTAPTVAGGMIRIGSLFTDVNADYWSKMASNFDAVAHEIFHAYVFMRTGVWGQATPNVEMDAYLFGMLACAEMDGRRGLNKDNHMITGVGSISYVQNMLGGTVWDVDGNASVTDRAKYQDAVYEMFRNGSFTVAHYNDMAELWATVSYYGVLDQTTANQRTESAFEASIIKELWTNSYSQSTYFSTLASRPLFLAYDPIPGSGGGGGGGFDPYSNGWSWDSGMGQYGGWQSTTSFVTLYYSTGGQGNGGGFDWDSFWDWLDDWSGTNWGIVGDVFWAPAGEVLA